MSTEENELIKRRKSCKGTLTRLFNYVKDFNKEVDDIQEIYARETLLEDVYNKFNECQDKLEIINYDTHSPTRETFEDKYLSTKASINKWIKQHEKENNALTPSAISINSNTDASNKFQLTSQIKLPDVHLPSFSGDYQDWQNFKDLFIGIVHDNAQILPIQKLYYLKGALRGEAHTIIQAIAPSADNYEIAWQLLTERYDNKQFNVNCHLKALFDLPCVTRDSVSSLRKLLTDTKQHLRSLETLEIPVNQWDVILIYLLCNKLDPSTRREWELSKKDEKLPTLAKFYKFLEQRCLALEFVNQDKIKFVNKVSHAATATTGVYEAKSRMCKVCKGKYHPLYQCDTFRKYDIQQRIKAIKSIGACYNCLRFGHSNFQCNTRGCKICNKKHNTLIHQSKNTAENSTESSYLKEKIIPTDTPKKESTTNQTELVSLHNANSFNQILLATAKIKVLDHHGTWQVQRAILDSASQLNFIRRETVNKLKLKTRKINTSINGISETTTVANETVYTTIASSKHNFQRKIEFIILENITSELPAVPVNILNWNIPENLEIADTDFNKPGIIDILLGGEVFYDILDYGQLKLGRHLPVLQNTKLGWVIGGKIGIGPINKNVSNQTYLVTPEPEISLEKCLMKFWEIETISERTQTQEERKCEEHFHKTTVRDEDGRYIVKLPLKVEKTALGNSYYEAIRRFTALEKRFSYNPELKTQYSEFMNEYISLNHMQLAPEDLKHQACYIPHHPVFKCTNNKKKIRVVFDASMKTTSGKSLNDILMVGPVVQQELIDIILRFRKYLVVFSADVEKMYRQILVADEQLDLQQILWRNEETDKIDAYQLKTVTYGTASAPYLATKVLNQIAIDEAQKYPIAAARVCKDFYVDDIMTGTDSIESCLILQNQMIGLLNEGKFNLRKWCANKAELLDAIKPEDRETQLPLRIGCNEVKTLGLLWLPAEDNLKLVINVKNEIASETKRKILRDIASIFDPLGILGPVITVAKLIMQQLWKLKINWDEPVPDEILNIWRDWRYQLENMKKVQIERCLFNQNNRKTIEIHGFCDASQKAYGAVLYILTKYEDGSKSVKLLCSKSRSAPLKQITLPRLELCGALILAKMVNRTIMSLEMEIENVYLWSDSMIVLAWLQSQPTRWHIFVANRISEIQELTSKYHWNHVASENNPADCLSRGLQLKQLLTTQIWWEGPSWLIQPKSEWPKTKLSDYNEKIPEEKPHKITTLTATYMWNIFNKFSTLNKLQRVVAYCLRFVNNIRKQKNDRCYTPLTPNELNQSLKILIKNAQNEVYHFDITHIKNKKVLNNQSPLKSLNCFLDTDQLLRVGGRIQKSIALYDQQHPIVLPKNHELTKLIIEQEHRRLLHGGVQAILSSIRRKYWPISGRNITRYIINKCITCHRFKASPANQLMGNLPSYRVQPARPFLNTGIDYGGPIYIKQGYRRNSPLKKAYIALFICLCTRAVHIELVSDLSTKSLLLSLKRFMARRGKCKTIYSDNASNFKGACHELHELYELFKATKIRNHISEVVANEGITWHFIPPRAPHFGGIWEAGIKSTKYHLKRVLGKANLNFEEVYTTLTLIEACLNSRPLTPLTHDPDDFSILTPAHFLIGDLLTAVPEPDLTDQADNILTKWQHVQRMQQHFWQRWSKEYLSYLQQRHKWTKIQPNQQKGMVVLLKEENLPPLNWSIARIIKTHPGEDGCIRVVTVKTPDGKEFKRPVSKICPLPIENITNKIEDDSSRRPGCPVCP